MFSGIIETMGKMISLDKREHGALLILNAPDLARKVKRGDSIAVNGVCLTVMKKSAGRLSFDVSGETWKRSNLSFYGKGQELNLELPVTAQTMLSGHFVQGHVEGKGYVSNWILEGGDARLFVDLPSDLMAYCVPKGSIAINGVSLTIASMQQCTIEMVLIPYTLDHTNLRALKAGNPVNIETDMIGRYVVSTIKKTYDKP